MTPIFLKVKKPYSKRTMQELQNFLPQHKQNLHFLHYQLDAGLASLVPKDTPKAFNEDVICHNIYRLVAQQMSLWQLLHFVTFVPVVESFKCHPYKSQNVVKLWL